MLTEVMRYYELARAPVDLSYFETEHHTQLIRDLRASIAGGRLIALTAVIGSGKTLLVRRLRDELERDGRVIVSRALTLERSKVTVPLLVTALFYDLSPEKVVTIPGHPERRERDLQELFRKAKKPVVLLVDDAHDLHGNTLKALKRLIELVQDGGGQLSVVLIGHPRLKNDLRRPIMEEIGDRATVLEFGGLRDRQRAYLDWALVAALKDGVDRAAIITDDAITLLAAKLTGRRYIGGDIDEDHVLRFDRNDDDVEAFEILSRQLLGAILQACEAAIEILLDRRTHDQVHIAARHVDPADAAFGGDRPVDGSAAIDGAPSEKCVPLMDTALKPLWAAYAALSSARDQREPLVDETPRQPELKRMGGKGLDGQNIAPPACGARHNRPALRPGVGGKNIDCHRRLLAPDDGGAPLIERQQRERPRRQEMLHGLAVMRQRMADGGDDRGLAIGPAMRRNARLQADGRFRAVGADQEARRDLRIPQIHRDTFITNGKAGETCCRDLNAGLAAEITQRGVEQPEGHEMRQRLAFFRRGHIKETRADILLERGIRNRDGAHRMRLRR